MVAGSKPAWCRAGRGGGLGRFEARLRSVTRAEAAPLWMAVQSSTVRDRTCGWPSLWMAVQSWLCNKAAKGRYRRPYHSSSATRRLHAAAPAPRRRRLQAPQDADPPRAIEAYPRSSRDGRGRDRSESHRLGSVIEGCY